MPQSLAQVFTHTTFSTKHRNPIISDNIAGELHAYLGGVCREMDTIPIKVGGHYDHVHLLCALSRKVAIMDLLEEIKKRSSKWIKTKGDEFADFYWQGGYAIFSVNPKDAEEVVRYIMNQKAHHGSMSFQDECRVLFRENNIEWDDRYVWD